MIAKGDFVRLSFTAKLEDGTIIDTTDEEIARENGIYNENAKYGDIYAVVGEEHVVKGLDEDLEGKEVGYSGKVVVPPEKAFGKYDPDNKDTFSLSRFKERPQVGQRVRIGNRLGTVERIVGRRVIVDFNHPLAGKNIIFEYEIKEKLEKPEDKIKALFSIHTGIDVIDVKIENSLAVVEVPRDAYLNQLFLIGRYRVVNDAMRFLDIKEMWIVEKFRKDEEIVKFVQEVKEEDKEEGPPESKVETEDKEEVKREEKKDEEDLIIA
jgi:FKBP-type peptidyl-prolyl cis-trans isomerase SlyD